MAFSFPFRVGITAQRGRGTALPALPALGDNQWFDVQGVVRTISEMPRPTLRFEIDSGIAVTAVRWTTQPLTNSPAEAPGDGVEIAVADAGGWTLSASSDPSGYWDVVFPPGGSSAPVWIAYQSGGRWSEWSTTSKSASLPTLTQPEIDEPPSISGTPEVGQAISAVPGTWRYASSVSTVLTVGGVTVTSPYTLLPADDGAAILLTETASGDGGTVVATASATAIYAAPTASGEISDQRLDVDEVATLDVTSYFTGTGGTWSVSGTQSAGAAVSINTSGVIAFDTTSEALGTVTAVYTNSGGTASRSFLLRIETASADIPWTPADQPDMVLWVAADADVTVASNRVTEWRSRSNTMTTGTVSLLPYDQGSGEITAPSWDAATSTLSWGPGTDAVSALRALLPADISPEINGGLTAIALLESTVYAPAGTIAAFGKVSLGETNTRGSWSLARPMTFGDQTPTQEPRVSMRDAGKYIAVIRSRIVAAGCRTSTWVNGVLADEPEDTTTGASYAAADTVRIGATPAITDPAATADNTSLHSTRIAAVAIVRGVLDDKQRQNIEGYLRWEHALASTITLTDHPWSGTPPVVGSVPSLVNTLPSLSVYPSAAINEVNLAEFFGGATSYGISGDGLGLSVIGSYLRGTPTGSGTVTVTATNDNGTTNADLTLTVLTAPTVASDFPTLWSVAAAATPGDSITLAEALTSLDATIFETAALTGNTTATLVGYTDFRISGPMPAGTEYDNFRRIPHRTSNGTAISANTLPAHPLWTLPSRSAQYLRGPETQADAVPFDHIESAGGNVPIGLKLETWELPNNFPYLATNGVRHTGIEHDGHILWVAEYLCEDGVIRTFMEEMDGTRALNPRFCHRNAINTPGQRATHLRRLATIRIATMASRMTDILSTSDSRRWTLQAKRERHDYATVQYAGASGTGATWAEMNAHIAAQGKAGLEANAVGGEYRIRLAAAVMEGTSYPSDPYTRFTAAAVTVLQTVAGIRVVLIGTPGKTIVPFWYGPTNVRCLDVCWITITRVRGNNIFLQDPGSVRTDIMLVGQQSHLRMFGCVVDGIDSTTSTGIVNTAVDEPGAVFEFYDGVLTGMAEAIQVNKESSGPIRPAPKIIVARSIIDATNDQVQLYGRCMILLEGNHFIGAGGLYTNRAWQHRDTMTQLWVIGGKVSYAAYNNIVQSGPNYQTDLNLRAASNLFMQQNGMIDAFEVVGNIFVQEPTLSNRGINEFEPFRKAAPPDGEQELRYFYRACVAYNMFIYLPDLYSAGDTYPAHAFGWIAPRPGTSSAPQILDNLVGFSNLSLLHIDFDLQMGFDRVVNFFPEEVDNRTTLLDASEAFNAFPTVTGAWATGYTLDWTGTAYAGTSREGYFAPADLAVAVPLRRWSSDGLTGGPGLPFHGNYMDRFTGLPANINVHLGWVDALGDDFGGSGYLPDWFGPGTFNPTPTTLNATVVDPWTAQSGDTDRIEDKMLTIFSKLGTLGSGIIAEETAADGAKWTLEILPTTYRPRFTVRDSGSAIVYQMTGTIPVAANSRLMVGIETGYRRHIQETFAHWTIVKRMMYEHFRVNGSTDDFIIDFESATTAPTRVAGADHYIWIDLSDFNTVKVWDGSAWVAAQGDLSEVGSFWAQGRANDVDGGHWEDEYRWSAVPALRDRFYLAENVDDFIAGPRTVAPAVDDWVFLIEAAPNEFSGTAVRRWDGSEWRTNSGIAGGYSYGGRMRAPNSGTMRGLPNIILRVDGKNCIRQPDWISANVALNYGRAFMGLPPATASIDFVFPVADATKLVVYARPWEETTVGGELRLWQTGSRTGTAMELGVDYSVTLNADQATNPGGTITFLRDLPGYTGSVRVDSGGTAMSDELAKSTDVRVVLNYTATDYTARGMDRALPRGTVRVGDAVGVGAYSGTMRWVGARRFMGVIGSRVTEPQYPEWASTALDHRFARQPAYINASLDEHPVFAGTPDVWVVAS